MSLRKLGMACLLCLAAPHIGLAREYYVAANGSDANAGTRAAPFATLAQAQAAVRSLLTSENKRQRVTVFVRGGMYQLAQTLKLTAEDSSTTAAPVVYQAYHGERPVLTGAVPIRGFTVHKGAILKANVPSQLKETPFRQLYFEDKRQPLAQYPNVDPAAPDTSGWAFVDPEPVAQDTLRTLGPKRVFRFSRADVRSWSRPTDGDVFIYPSHQWWNNIVPIETVDRARRQITLKRNCSYEIHPGDRYFVRGLFEELDAPGEWYLDVETGSLYFWPPHSVEPENVTVWVPGIKTLVQMDGGPENITLRGLVLECCAQTAVVMSEARHCELAGCTIHNTTGYSGAAVAVRGGSGNRIVGCDIYDVGSNGIQLGGGDQNTLTPAANVAENNHVTRTGLDYRQGVGIAVRGVGNRVSHNTIHHVPRFAIQFGGNNNVIELNHLHHVCLDTMDTGAIYGMSLNWLSAHGTVIRHNFIHDVIGRSGKSGKWLSPYYAWGIYLDWTAMGCTVTGNIVARCPRAGIHLHDGRDHLIENNVVIDCGTGAHEHVPGSQIEANGWNTESQYWKRGLTVFGWAKQYERVVGEPAWRNVRSLRDPRTLALSDGRTMFNNTVRCNILSYRDPDALAMRFRNVPVDHNVCDRNLIWHDGLPIRTGLFKVKDTNGPNLIANPGFEVISANDTPSDWHGRLPSAQCTATSVSNTRHSGNRSLSLHAVASAANADKPPWERQVAASSLFIKRVTPGQAYRFSLWLKADKDQTSARIEPLSYRANAYHVSFGRDVTVGVDWKRYEVAFRFPQDADANYHEGMTDTFYVRITLRCDAGTLWIDDAELRAATVLSEWKAWQEAGWDQDSIVTDPLFVDPANDDYRLQPSSPAWKLGFKPIPVEQIGCYRDSRRASWPVEQ